MSEKKRRIRLKRRLDGPWVTGSAGDIKEVPARVAVHILEPVAAAGAKREAGAIVEVARDEAMHLIAYDQAEVLPWWTDAAIETPSDGFAPEDALLALADRATRAVYELFKTFELAGSVIFEPERFEDRCYGWALKARGNLERALYDRLQSRDLVARGHPEAIPISGDRPWIDSERWDTLRFRHDNCIPRTLTDTAEMDGLTVYSVRIFRREDVGEASSLPVEGEAQERHNDRATQRVGQVAMCNHIHAAVLDCDTLKAFDKFGFKTEFAKKMHKKLGRKYKLDSIKATLRKVLKEMKECNKIQTE